jgi:hypothetical protein
VKSYKNLYPQVCSLENVMAAARSAMQGKSAGRDVALPAVQCRRRRRKRRIERKAAEAVA